MQLPSGATATKLTFYWQDSETLSDGTCKLLRTDFSGSSVLMASASTSGDAGGANSSEDAIIYYDAVDNSQYAYYVELFLPSANVQAYGVVIEYTITEPY